ncbi:MAG: hypothetical protein ABJK37_12860 [Paraglaciecola sp.]|uniref:hypothetical protein n=1 Tax=Paraglaciecola sp. TaxID=1920173 RepID=UPI0032998C41
MSIESVSTLKTSDITRTSREKPRVAKSDNNHQQEQSTPKVSIIRAGDNDSVEKAAAFKQQSNTISGSSLNEKSAIAAYESVAKEQQRQGIQLLLGVDTFV